MNIRASCNNTEYIKSMRCELCLREIEDYTIHHLIPISKNGAGGSTSVLCKACHRMIHHTFSNKELQLVYNTLEKVRSRPQIMKFLKWVRKQDPHKRIKIS